MKIDWIAAILIFIGNFILIEKKVWWCFLIFFIGNLLWFLHWLFRHEWAAMFLVGAFMIQNIWGIISWRK